MIQGNGDGADLVVFVSARGDAGCAEEGVWVDAGGEVVVGGMEVGGEVELQNDGVRKGGRESSEVGEEEMAGVAYLHCPGRRRRS